MLKVQEPADSSELTCTGEETVFHEIQASDPHSLRHVSLDNFEEVLEQSRSTEGTVSVRLTSPRSLQVCRAHGVAPSELLPVDLGHLERSVIIPVRRNALGKEIQLALTPGERRALALRRYHELEERRVATLLMLKRARNQLLYGNETGTANEETSSVAPSQRKSTSRKPVPTLSEEGRSDVGSLHSARSPQRIRTRALGGGSHSATRRNSVSEAMAKQMQWEHEVYVRDRETRHMCNEERHRVAKERAELLRRVQQEQYVKEQIAKDKMYQQRVRRLQFSKALEQEQRRLHHDRLREQNERLKRIQDYRDSKKTTEMLKVKADPLSQDAIRLQKEIQKFRIQAAKQLYSDPQYRVEKARLSARAVSTPQSDEAPEMN